MTDSPSSNRRKFSRVSFIDQVLLEQQDKTWNCQLIDLSLHGLLLDQPSDWQADLQQPFRATLSLSETTKITMQVILRHSENHQIGFECNDIDIDSISHLRRLVELNLGDTQLLERELAQLGNQG